MKSKKSSKKKIHNIDRDLQSAVLLLWDELPEFMRTNAVRPYYDVLDKRRRQLILKRVFDLVVGCILLVFFLIPMLIIAIAVKLDTPGPAIYRQIRVTTYGRRFKINKFRTMYVWAEDIRGVKENDNESSVNIEHDERARKVGNNVTVSNDSRVTKVGAVLRKYRMDELPQVINIILGDMSFVGTRPEVVNYVDQYQDEWNATLLMAAGVTSEASIRYKDEDKLLDAAEDVDKVYIEKILPGKMKWNLESIRKFGFIGDIKTMFRTVAAVCGKDYESCVK